MKIHKINQTIVRGKVVFDENVFVVKGGYGKFIYPMKQICQDSRWCLGWSCNSSLADSH